MNYKIVTEASVDMPKGFAEENDITVLPIEVNFNGDLYPEGLPNDEFYKKVIIMSNSGERREVTLRGKGVEKLQEN